MRKKNLLGLLKGNHVGKAKGGMAMPTNLLATTKFEANFSRSLFVFCLLCLFQLLLCLSAATLIAQTQQPFLTKPITLSWQPQPLEIPLNDGTTRQVLSFGGANFDLPLHPFPIFSQKTALPSDGQLTAKVRNLEYELLTLPDNMASYADNFIKNDIVLQAKITYDRKKPYSFVSFLPIRRNPQTGQYEKLVRFDLEYSLQPQAASALQKGNRTYAEQSVLAQGSWYKFKLQETGIYKIDRQFLQNLGLSGSIYINNVRIHGNGGGMLPELAGTLKFDDLVENPVQVTDNNNNGLFDDDDYLLFYGQGPNAWSYNNTTKIFEYQVNSYTTHNFYFLSTDAGTSQKIQLQTEPEPGPTVAVYTFDDYSAHEYEKTNPNNGGRKFYGEEFGIIPTQNFSFNFPNIVPTYKPRITASLMARSIGAGSSFTLHVNDQNLFTQYLNSVEGSYTSDYGVEAVRMDSISIGEETATINVSLTYNAPNASAAGWLDYLTVNVKRQLIFEGGQLKFRRAQNAGNGYIEQYIIGNLLPDNASVWDVTQPNTVKAMKLNYNVAEGSSNFYAEAGQVREYIAFDGTNYLSPEAVGRVDNQNLHALEFPDYIIITHANFLSQAEQLADFHRQNSNLTVKVVTTEQVYNEFASGAPDISAIRDYVKMYYDRAGLDEDLMPDYLLLFGDASYDYKNIEVKEENNSNFVPVYEYSSSLDTNGSFCTDDYFGALDDLDGDQMSDRGTLIDVAIGRLPTKTADEAQGLVDKIRRYASTSSLGDWRNRVTVIGDDEDSNTHLKSAEKYANYIGSNYPRINVDKIYLDAYQQVATAGGNSYPDVNRAIDKAIFNGAVLIDYAGHGGERAWAHETILSLPQIKAWDNTDKLPVFITATCSFGRYDNPDLTSGGEEIVLKSDGGAIAAFTTNRLVYAAYNERLNLAVLEYMFLTDNEGAGLPMGEIMRLGKNEADTASSSQAVNNRKFALLGDPALRLALPRYSITTSTLNTQPLATADTLKAMAQITITGEVKDRNGNLMTDFNGIVYPTVYDKIITLSTRVNDPPENGVGGSSKIDFTARKNIIFKGKASVTGGQFSFTFIVPRDIMYQIGPGRISYYAENGSTDAQGYSEQIMVGGVSDNAGNDTEGPKVSVYMNDENFVFGGTTNETPVLFIKLEDLSGINTIGNSIGHDLMAILDNDDNQPYNLNAYYETETDNYKKGSLRYPLSKLAVGPHNVSIKAWDVFNNSGTGYTEFIVAESADLALRHVLNYPNPFTDYTDFWFEHNQAGQTLDITIQVMSLSGRIVKTINRQITSDGFRVNNITWDGLDDFGNKIGRGTYVYTLKVETPTGQTAHKVEKLVILK